MKKTSLIALLLTITMCFTSCFVTTQPTGPSTGEQTPGTQTPGTQTPGTQNPGGDQTPGGDKPVISDHPSAWGTATALPNKYPQKIVFRGEPTDIKDMLDPEFETEGATWQSDCTGIATVTDGVVTGVKYGKTNITATDALGAEATVTVIVEFGLSSNSGYTVTTKKDETVYKVESEYEANRILDRAIADHVESVTLDFSEFGEEYFAFEDFVIDSEFGNHVSRVRTYYENTPHLLTMEFTYESATASDFVPSTPANTYSAVANGNMIIRLEQLKDSASKRADDYEGFAINTNNNGTFPVYNSEELWWALQQNYLPTFPNQGSKAELFYERAKMILREIITDDMDELDKVIAISEYLIDAVAYDYDSLDALRTPENDVTTNVCYYLEGVFERGIAVCDGKSKAFVLLCRIEGIECVRDSGNGRDGGVGHAWNYVNVNDVWYLVDTTHADSNSDADVGLGEYYGKNIEFMTYDTVLTDVAYHWNEYVYSDIFWDSIISVSDLDDYVDEMFSNTIYGTEYDFYMNTQAELAEVVTLLLSTDLCDEVILTFRADMDNDAMLDVGDEVSIALDTATQDSSVDYNLFSIGDGEQTIYIVLFKNI